MCDTFIALPPATMDGSIIFAKNSDRPTGEGQSLLVCPATEARAGEMLQCTYIEIPQAAKTHKVLLSKIDWMWGAEMGANEHGVIIGNEAVWTTLEAGPPALLGMDLVRLGLERAKSAREAVDVITALLEEFGQGGACAQNDPGFTYDNSYLIADFNAAYVLETAGRNWVAQRISAGTRNISNRLSIRDDHDFGSANPPQVEGASMAGAKDNPIDFARQYSAAPLSAEQGSREHWGAAELAKNSGKITPDTMKQILRDHHSGICMHGGFETTASMVSQLLPDGQMNHWIIDHPHPCSGTYQLVDAFG